MSFASALLVLLISSDGVAAAGSDLDISDQCDAIENAMAEGDDSASIETLFAELEVSVESMRTPISAPLAARLLVLTGMQCFFGRDSNASPDEALNCAKKAFGSAKDTFPATSLPARVVPQTHPLQRAFDEATMESSSPISLVTSSGQGHNAYRVNGLVSQTLYPGAPSIFQRQDAEGHVLCTELLWMDTSPARSGAPQWPEDSACFDHGPSVVLGTARVGVLVTWTAALAAWGGAGLAVASTNKLGDRVRANDPHVTTSTIDESVARTNTIGYVAEGVTALALVGTGVWVVVKW